MTIRYLNTDLDLAAPIDLAPLTAAFEARGMCALQMNRGDDGFWRASFEAEKQRDEPEATISDILAVVEALPGPIMDSWRACTHREFNIGYDCGAEPWAFNNGLSPQLLRRLAGVDAGLRITLYPLERTRPSE